MITEPINKGTKVATVDLSEEKSPTFLIQKAIEQGSDLEKLSSLLSIRERYYAVEAKKAYHKAMSEFKANAPEVIRKDKKVKYSTKAGQTVSYSHATLSNIVKSITSKLSEYGLSVSWPISQDNQKIKVTCRITHFYGHSEDFTLEASADDSGGKNSIQAIGSTVSYLQRYTLLAATGLATADQDDDARSVEVEYITDKQQHEIRDLLISLFPDPKIMSGKEKSFLGYLAIESIERMPKSKYQTAKAALASMKKKVEPKPEKEGNK